MTDAHRVAPIADVLEDEQAGPAGSHLCARELICSAPHARDWLDQQLNDLGPVGLSWVSPCSPFVLRLVTNNPRVFEHPELMGDASRQVDAWVALRPVRFALRNRMDDRSRRHGTSAHG